MPLLLLLALLCGGCTGQLVAVLEQRQIASCIWWAGPLHGRGVTATGGATLAQCLAVPCQGR